MTKKKLNTYTSEFKVLVGCMAHARRKFDEAFKALPKEGRKNKMGMAQTALRQFARLYALEKQFKDLTVEQRYLLRQEKSKPLRKSRKIKGSASLIFINLTFPIAPMSS